MTPKTIISGIREWKFSKKENGRTALGPEFWMANDKKLLEKEMKIAAKSLDFERAAEIRDLMEKLETKRSV